MAITSCGRWGLTVEVQAPILVRYAQLGAVGLECLASSSLRPRAHVGGCGIKHVFPSIPWP